MFFTDKDKFKDDDFRLLSDNISAAITAITGGGYAPKCSDISTILFTGATPGLVKDNYDTWRTANPNNLVYSRSVLIGNDGAATLLVEFKTVA